MSVEIVSYEADGLQMRSEFHAARDHEGPSPAILVFPEIFGLGSHARSVAQQLARIGFSALACDLHGEGRVISDLNEVMTVMAPVRADIGRVRARTQAALSALQARLDVDRARIAAIGYCFGGTMAFELARSGADIAGAVGFHSGLTTTAPQDARNIKGKILACIGADDPGISPGDRAGFEREMRDGGVDWQLHLYGGVVHSFTNPDAAALGMPEFARYDADADRRSWATLLRFLEEIF
jgi:dienelactone hydrolase